MRSLMSSLMPTFDRRLRTPDSSKDKKTAGGSSRSRSTSSGSSSAPTSQEESATAASTTPYLNRSATEGIPEYYYPVPFIVKNTFIETDTWQPSSLDGFLQERQIHSCISRIGATPSVDSLASSGSGIQTGSASPKAAVAATSDPSSHCRSRDVGRPEFVDAMEVVHSSGYTMSYLPTLLTSPPPPVYPSVPNLMMQEAAVPPPSKALVLRLAEALREPELGSPELPTVGSAGHQHGSCKPCAFFHTKGCMQGPECEFCHLCEPGERKRRRKEKIELLRKNGDVRA